MNLKEAKEFIKEFIENARENFEVKQGSEQVTNIFEKDIETGNLKTEFSGMSFFIDDEKIAVYSIKFKKNEKGNLKNLKLTCCLPLKKSIFRMLINMITLYLPLLLKKFCFLQLKKQNSIMN